MRDIHAEVDAILADLSRRPVTWCVQCVTEVDGEPGDVCPTCGNEFIDLGICDTEDAEWFAVYGIVTDRLTAAVRENITLRQTLAAVQRDYTVACHERSRLRAQIARAGRKRAPWRDYPLATLATAWDALVGREREHLGGVLLLLGGIAAVLLAVTFGPGVIR